jgi:integrase
VLDGKEWHKLIDSIPTDTVRDLRDRALIATLTYSFARMTAALRMKVEDLRPKGAGWQIQLHEKGGKQHAMPCHHALADTLRAYIDAGGIAEDEPVIDAARTVKRHWDGILRWFDSKIANGLIEGINSLVQAAKAKARGYRSTRNLKAIIYLLAGKLDLRLPA